MKVHIVEAARRNWYKVGEVFDVKDRSLLYYEFDNGHTILKSDCVVIEEEEEETPLPVISYHGATTVVRWPDGEINSAKPCQAQPENNIKADRFDPTIGFLHCIAKKYLPDYKKIIASVQNE